MNPTMQTKLKNPMHLQTPFPEPNYRAVTTSTTVIISSTVPHPSFSNFRFVEVDR
jgi:hypothetical protein